MPIQDGSCYSRRSIRCAASPGNRTKVLAAAGTSGWVSPGPTVWMLPVPVPAVSRSCLVPVESIMLHRFANRARLLTMTVGPLVVVALVLAAGRRWV
jgi:hypothetical protein